MTAASALEAVASYRHEALLWSGTDDFLAGVVPFVRAGVLADEQVMVAVIDERRELVRNELGALAKAVRFVDMSELGRNPARIIPAWQSFIDECAVGGRPVRGVGEPIWCGRRADEVRECHLHEALLNVAVAPSTPLWLLCPYDVNGLPPAVVAEAVRTHPHLVGPDALRPWGRYAGDDQGGDTFRSDLPAGTGLAFLRAFNEGNLRVVHDDVYAEARDAGISPDRCADLALAVHEVATNSVVHALGEGVLRIWREPDALVCEVRDLGQILDPMAGRLSPALQAQHGRGLWMVNQLCDLVQIRSHAAGTTVRIHTWL